MSKVSVILPVYNSERYLAAAVHSMLAQDYPDFEVIIVDDASTDSSPSVYSEIRDARIKVIRLPVRVGVTKALNIGVAAASGVYLARMDADDISERSRLSRQVDALTRSPRLGAVGCWAHILDAKGTVIAEHCPPTSHDAIKFAFLFYAPILHPSAMMTSVAFRSVGGYNESFLYAQDRDLFLRIASKWELAIIPEFLFSSRRTPESISLTKEVLQKQFSVLALRNAIRIGVYSRYWSMLVELKSILANLPAPILVMKNYLLRFIGLRHG